MAALLGLDVETVKALASEAAQGEVCEVANDNAPGQIVVSGNKAAIERAVEIAKAKGSRAMLLPVSAPFHCALMKPAAAAMAEAISKVTVRTPNVSVIANITAQPVKDPTEIVKLLIAQGTGTVRWRESVGYLASRGVKKMVETGTGKVLGGLIRRIARGILTINVGTAEDVAVYKMRT